MSAASADGQERPSGESPAERRRAGKPLARRPLAATGAGVLCLAGGLYMAQANHDADLLRKANQAGLARRYEDALRTAREIHQPPADGRALAVEAYALGATGRLAAANDALVQAIRRDPANWVLHQDRAVLLASMGWRTEAATEMGKALALNPRLQLPDGFVLKPRRSARRARLGGTAP